MALTGIEIYKNYLPKTNCRECGFPTCLAFAIKLAQREVDPSLCPYLSEEARQALEAQARPPIRLITIGSERPIEVGGEVVMFRHEKTFYHQPGIMVRIRDTEPPETVLGIIDQVANYSVERVGLELGLDGFAIENTSGDSTTFIRCIELARSKTDMPLVIMSNNPTAMNKALEVASQGRPLIYAATRDNLDDMVGLSLNYHCPLAVYGPGGLEGLSELVERATGAGVEDIVLDPGARGFAESLTTLTQLRRLALKRNLLGYPIITFPGEGSETIEEEALLAGQQVARYAGIIVLDHFSPALVYPLLTLRLNIYTDPQRPIQMTPGLYTIGSPRQDSPLCVTTNFSLTYFSIAGELESSGFPSWLLVCDTEGLSVLTSWAAGKFDAEKIVKMLKEFSVSSSISHRSLIIPGHVAVLRGELEEELPDWRIMVGPREAVDIGGYLKRNWRGDLS